jgi:hypothetical protein
MSTPIQQPIVNVPELAAIGRYFGLSPDQVAASSTTYRTYYRGRDGYMVHLESIAPPRLEDGLPPGGRVARGYDVIVVTACTERGEPRRDELSEPRIYQLQVFLPLNLHDEITGATPELPPIDLKREAERWIERERARLARAERCYRLMQRGLDRHIASDLAHYGKDDVINTLEQANDEQIRELNRYGHFRRRWLTNVTPIEETAT